MRLPPWRHLQPGPKRVPDDGAVSALRWYRVDLERRGLLPRSIDKREACLRSFARWLDPRGLLDAVPGDVELFLDKRRTSDGHTIDPRTRYHWISDIHSFYAWAAAQELVVSDPTSRIVRPKIRRTVPRPIDRSDLDFAIRAANRPMKAMLCLAAFGGLRVSEIAGLRREDVIVPNRLIHIQDGKGAKSRILPLHHATLAALERMPMPASGPVFLRPMGGRYPSADLSRAMNQHLSDLEIDATAHQLRHWFATEVYAETHDLRMTQELLGHSHPSTTAGYVAYSRADAAAAVGSLRVPVRDALRHD